MRIVILSRVYLYINFVSAVLPELSRFRACIFSVFKISKCPSRSYKWNGAGAIVPLLLRKDAKARSLAPTV